jgi:S1-C subfamily serine protease
MKRIIIAVCLIGLLAYPVFAQGLNDEVKFTFGFEARFDDQAHVVRIESVQQNSPAERAGIKSGDYIMAIDYNPNVVSFLIMATRQDPVAKKRTFTIQRDQKLFEVDIQPESVKK